MNRSRRPKPEVVPEFAFGKPTHWLVSAQLLPSVPVEHHTERWGPLHQHGALPLAVLLAQIRQFGQGHEVRVLERGLGQIAPLRPPALEVVRVRSDPRGPVAHPRELGQPVGFVVDDDVAFNQPFNQVLDLALGPVQRLCDAHGPLVSESTQPVVAGWAGEVEHEVSFAVRQRNEPGLTPDADVEGHPCSHECASPRGYPVTEALFDRPMSRR